MPAIRARTTGTMDRLGRTSRRFLLPLAFLTLHCTPLREVTNRSQPPREQRLVLPRPGKEEGLKGPQANNYDFLRLNTRWNPDSLLTPEIARNHAVYADSALRAFPWASKVPRDVFNAFVLPHQARNEKIDDWRPFFFNALKPVLAGATTTEDAVFRINTWLNKTNGVRFEQNYSKPRDPGPLTTFEWKQGMCGELSELLVAACRSVGIPAREASIPIWPIPIGNHAWVEVYSHEDRKWHAVGGAEPSKFGDTWFKTWQPAVVNASSRFPSPGAIKRGPYYLTDVTASYVPPGDLATLRVKLEGKFPKDVQIGLKLFAPDFEKENPGAVSMLWLKRTPGTKAVWGVGQNRRTPKSMKSYGRFRPYQLVAFTGTLPDSAKILSETAPFRVRGGKHVFTLKLGKHFRQLY